MSQARAGIRIVERALEEPLRQIASNSGDHAEIVVNRVKEHQGNYGYDAVTGEYGDLVQEGISTAPRLLDWHSRTPPRSPDYC